TYREQNPEWFVLSPEPPKDNRGDEYNFSDLPPLARIIAWLIVSHHRLPITEKYNTNNNDDFHNNNDDFQKKTKFDTLDDWFSNFIPTEDWVYQSHADSIKYDLAADPTQSPVWQKMLSRWATKALQRIEAKQFFGTNADGDLSTLLQDPLFLHLSRLCLMVGDHYFSAKKYSENNQKKYALPLWANTDKNAPDHAKQLLDEHLCGVADIAKQFAHVFLWADKPFAALNKCKELSKPAQESRFFWQNTAFELGRKLHHSSQEQGFFGVNTAGTGCGKTLANAKIAYALSGEKQTRITIALGLRTLTLQTGEALRKKLHLTDNEIATLIGSSAIKQLFENNQDKTHHGSESADDAYFHADETFAVMRDESAFADNIYRFLMPDNKTDNKIKTLLDTPIIACTIDHLMQVCEQQRSAHFVPPMLRLLSSDIVLDEPDDFSTEDLPALSRLIYWIGLCGGRLLLSSATLTPDLCEGLFRAYQDARRIYNKHFGLPENKIVCAWFNEFNTHFADCDKREEYREQHTEFCKKQINQLQTLPIRRRAEILPLDNADYPQLAERFISAILELHARHGIEYQGQKISIGLLRFANIEPLIKTARAMLQLSTALPDTQLHITCYHGRQLLFLRSRIEEILDRLLHRNNPAELFRQPEIKQAIQNPAKNHIFVVFGSPVTEVGRDHDYDWAIVEPSSLRSLIQLAGRVWRHRPEKVADTANIMVFNKNIKHLIGKEEIYYTRPGFEKKGFYRLNSQQKSAQNSALLSDEILQRIDAQARLKRPAQFNKNLTADNLSDLEHLVMAHLINPKQNFITAYRQPESVFHLTADMQKHSPFRESSPQIAYTALPDYDGTINWIQSENLAENLDSKNYDNRTVKYQEITSPHIHLWLNCSYKEELQA
ncbi:MAG: type I-F CRISPR-associated helicase Cas3, partial [Neisseriaceae bacterium]|nr:type I-F CRISPR-associated helicase Cas3 [Neisseriaceae bacterium]